MSTVEHARDRPATARPSSTLDSRFNSLDTLAKDTEVDARLAALKAGRAGLGGEADGGF
ncbi:MAG TPA: hypothetical protein VFN97_14875 [Actinospica sp.]|nr:hypothetical protein [Actinospica sp.]